MPKDGLGARPGTEELAVLDLEMTDEAAPRSRPWEGLRAQAITNLRTQQRQIEAQRADQGSALWLADLFWDCPGASPGHLTLALHHGLVSPKPSAHSNASSKSLTLPVGWDVPSAQNHTGHWSGYRQKKKRSKNP